MIILIIIGLTLLLPPQPYIGWGLIIVGVATEIAINWY